MAERTVTATEKHEAAYQDMCAVLKRHAHLKPEEMLAVACNFVGKLIAMQDQRKFTSATVMAMVSANIKAGNEQALEELLGSKGNG